MSDKWTEDKLRRAVEESISIAEVLRKLVGSAGGGSYRTFHKYRRLYDIDISHFKGQGWLGGETNKIPLNEILVEDSTYTNTGRLKTRILNAELLEYKCLFCGISEWRGKEISLHLDHVNGDPMDNRLENLRLLCPNCHSQTPTFAGRNIDKSRLPKPPTCADCTTEIDRRATRCKSCAAFHRQQDNTKINWPEGAELAEKVRKSTYAAVARELGVSDNAVRKRLKNHYEGPLP